MFEREIQFIYDFNQNKVKKLGSYMTYEQLEETEVHPAILQYISGEIDFLIFEDRQKLLKESLFDYSGEQISEHFAAISREIKRTKRFSLNYVEKLILHASSFTINYLSRPKWSILKFIFDEEKNKSALEIKQIFNYFYYYPYLTKIVLSYLDKKKVVTISFDEFKSLLEKIDNISLESNHNKVINEALDSLGEFLNIGLSKRKLIPLQAIQHFLKEKSLDPFLAKLEKDFPNPEITRYEMNDLKNSLKEVVFEVDRGEVQDEDEPFMKQDQYRPENVDTFGEGGHTHVEKTDEQPEEEPIEEESVEIPDLEPMLQAPEEIKDEEPIEEEFVVPEIEPEDEVLDSAPLSFTDSDEIDLAEDTRGDGEVLEDLTEVVKEEKEELELENLRKDEEDLLPQGDVLEDDTEEDEFIDFNENVPDEPELPVGEMSLPDEEETEIEQTDLIDDSVADELEEVKDEEFKQSPEGVLEETTEESEEKDFETKSSGSADLSWLEPYKEVEEDSPDKSISVEDDYSDEDNELNDVLDELVSEVQKVTETSETYESQPAEEEKEEDELTIDALLEDVEEFLDKRENDEELKQLGDELTSDGIPDYEKTDRKENEPTESIDEEPDPDEVLPDILDHILEDSEVETGSEAKDEDVFNDVDSSELLDSKSEVDDIAGEYDDDRKNDEDLKLFNDNDFEEKEAADEIGAGEDDNYRSNDTPKIDVSELLENKKMNKIIDTIFDYDMEDFANAIEKIVEARNEDDANKIVDNICQTAQVSPTSKEAKLFKSIISEYFEQT